MVAVSRACAARRMRHSSNVAHRPWQRNRQQFFEAVVYSCRKPRELRAVAPSQDVPSAWARARERSCGAQDDASRSFLSGAFLPLGVHPEAFHFAEKWNAEPYAAGAPAKLRGLSDWSSGCPLRMHLLSPTVDTYTPAELPLCVDIASWPCGHPGGTRRSCFTIFIGLRLLQPEQ